MSPIDIVYLETHTDTNVSFSPKEKKGNLQNATKHERFSSNEPWKFKLVVKKEC
jgi:hypothetical protein